MSFENVKSFYQRLVSDETFRDSLQAVNSDDEYSQVVFDAGYKFTQEEFEEYTSQLLESDAAESELKDLSKEELEAVFGGILGNHLVQPLYGVIRPVWPIKPIWPIRPIRPIRPQPLYGVVVNLD
uniref:Nif11-type n=1 Tax=Nostoc sp. PCC 9205 TaxID=2099383 RepID=A0A2P0ZGN6_9NOSO|nr:Nif11-type precursor [Nostoc sp. PCC 9205]